MDFINRRGMDIYYTALMWYKYRGDKRAETFAGKILGSVWLSAGVAMTILGFAGTYSGAYGPVFISPVLAAVLGIAFYVSALVYDSLLMKYLAPLWWAGSIFMFFFPGLHTIIVMAAMMLFLQVIPGIILYKKYKSGY
jgi:hypothetical protein